MPVTRPTGRALIVGSASCRPGPLATLQRLGYSCAEVDDPYAGMAELCRKPLAYRSIILSLTSLYREELALIAAVKRRWPHVDVWLTHTDGRHAALADAMRLGADGLLSDDGLHRTALAPTPASYAPRDDDARAPRAAVASRPDPAEPADEPHDSDLSPTEPILTAEELRALLTEQPITLPDESE